MSAEPGAVTLGGHPVGPTLIYVGAVASRPAANSDFAGRFAYDPTTGLFYVDGGGTWYATIPSLKASNTWETGNLTQRLVQSSVQGARWSVRETGDLVDRAALIDSGLLLGGGSAAADAVLRRISAGLIGFYDAAIGGNLIVVRIGEPVGSTDATTKGYVDTAITAAKARANHTGSQLAATISDFAAAVGLIAVGGDVSGTIANIQIAAGAVTDTEVAAANKDGAAGTASMRTLGTGATQAAAGNDSRFPASPKGSASRRPRSTR